MIAKGKAVSHEAAMMEYAITKDQAELIGSHGLHSNPVLMINLSAQEVLEEFQMHRQKFVRQAGGRPLQNQLLRFELCPTADEMRNCTRDDWRFLAEDFIRRLATIWEVTTKAGKKKVPITDIRNTQWVVVLHHDGADGCDHLHLMANRIDLDGNTINDSFLLSKAETVANQINEEMGWKQSMDIGLEHREELKKMCYDVLRSMNTWDWNVYFYRINYKGYETYRKFDDQGRQRGYSIYYGNASVPASEIDRGLTWGKIESTWKKLHAESNELKPKVQTYSSNHVERPRVQKSQQDVSHTTTGHATKPMESINREKRVVYPFVGTYSSLHLKSHILSLPLSLGMILQEEVTLPNADDYQDEEVDYQAPELNNIIKVAVLLFHGYVDAAVSMSESHGGGGGNTSGWGRKSEDDDRQWARRCARMASQLCAPPHHPRRVHYGRRR